MFEYTKPTNQEEWDENFSPIKPLMTATLAYNESSRCLFCYDAPCVKACPTSIDIPLFIRQIYSGNVEGAAKTIYNSNYFGNICGKVCPTEELCEGSCVYNNEDAKPIEIGRLQSYATTHAVKKDLQLFNPPAQPAHHKAVAIVGAGPAGIACACELRMLGYQVEIFEAKAQPSGLALHGVAPYKIDNQTVLDEVHYLQKMFGFHIHYNHPIHTAEQIHNLESRYAAVFLGIGLGATQTLGIRGEDLPGVIGATEFIEQVKLNPFGVHVGGCVMVIGGGNTAMDAASEAARLGANAVFLVYRRNRDQMSAYDFEVDLTRNVGVKLLLNMRPTAIIGEDKAEALRVVATMDDEHGNLMDTDIERDLECDMIIKATGQRKQTDFLSLIPNLQVDKRGCIVVNEHFQTTNPMFFASGDAVNGGAEVVNAVGEAKKAAQAIHRFIQHHYGN